MSSECNTAKLAHPVGAVREPPPATCQIRSFPIRRLRCYGARRRGFHEVADPAFDIEVIKGQVTDMTVPTSLVPAVNLDGGDPLSDDLITQAFGGISTCVGDANRVPANLKVKWDWLCYFCALEGPGAVAGALDKVVRA